MISNRRRTPDADPMALVHWWRTYRGAVMLLASMFLAGLVVGSLVTVSWYRHYRAAGSVDEALFPTSHETIALDYHPHVVDCFKCWTEDPHGNALLMVWSDGQVWRARTDNGETLGEWELLEHVRLGGTP